MRLEHVKQTQELEKLLERVEEATRQVPDQPREAEFLADLNRLADEHTIAIEDFQRGVETKTEGYSAVTVSMRLRGDYASVCRFIEAVSKLPRLTDLTEMTIQRDGDTTERSVNVTYALYYGLTTVEDAATESAL